MSIEKISETSQQIGDVAVTVTFGRIVPKRKPERCDRCGVALVIGKAMDVAYVSSPDFLGDEPSEGCTVNEVSTGGLRDCWKCPTCGKSWELKEDGRG